MKKAIGWILLGVIWGAFVLRMFVFPADIHGGYPPPIFIFNMVFDVVVVYPVWGLMPAFIRNLEGMEMRWVFPSAIAIYLLLVSAGIYLVLIKTRKA